MVLAGQYLERPAPVDAGDAVLDARYHRGRTAPALLVCPDPRPGGGMEAPLPAELAWAAARAGHACLRFELRGVGASSGSPDAARAVEDATAALRHLEETAGPALAVAACGAAWSVAYALARAGAQPAVSCLVLVAPDRPPGDPPEGARVLVVLPERGPGPRRDDVEAALGPAGRVRVVADADAQFSSGLPEVGRWAVGWLELG
jgi:alpha/beta superfamily hydrolase